MHQLAIAGATTVHQLTIQITIQGVIAATQVTVVQPTVFTLFACKTSPLDQVHDAVFLAGHILARLCCTNNQALWLRCCWRIVNQSVNSHGHFLTRHSSVLFSIFRTNQQFDDGESSLRWAISVVNADHLI